MQHRNHASFDDFLASLEDQLKEAWQRLTQR